MLTWWEGGQECHSALEMGSTEFYHSQLSVEFWSTAAVRGRMRGRAGSISGLASGKGLSKLLI